MSTQVGRRTFLKLGAGGMLSSLAGPLAFAQGEAGVRLIVRNARITTMDGAMPEARALALSGERFAAVGSEADVTKLATPSTTLIDAGGRRVIPGLHDARTHPIRGGLNYKHLAGATATALLAAIGAAVCAQNNFDKYIEIAEWNCVI